MFWSKEAYEISKKITSNNELHVDLVSHVFLLLHQLNIKEEELPKTFAKFAYNQWTWTNSQFNILYNRRRLTAEIPEYLVNKERQEEENEYISMLIDFIEMAPKDDNDLFCKEIAKMHLYGMTYRDIRNETNISLQIIHQAIKQFKNDLYTHYNNTVLHRDSQSTHDIQSARLETV